MSKMKGLNRILNIGEKEWPRIMASWGMLFLTRFGFIIGWSVLLATFLSFVGIEKLPYLFLANAVTVMLGTVFYRKIIQACSKEVLITFTALSASASILLSVLFIQSNLWAFFGILVVVQSVFIAQLMILISLFNEELFTPLESQRTFPIIESAETLGGIAGGVVLTLLAHQVPSYKFLLIWAVLLIFILPIVLRYNPRTIDLPNIQREKESPKSLHDSLSALKKAPFLKALMLIVFLHWSIMNVVEYQYTKAIQQEVYAEQEETLVDEDLLQIVLAGEESAVHDNEYYSQAITQKLGTLHIFFYSAALIIQLILASRIITKLGIISSLLIHPIVVLLNLIGLTLRFGFTTAVLARGGYELTSIIFKNAYDSSYYAIPHEERGGVKEFMQGIVKPIGAIFGTLLILLASVQFSGFKETFALNTLLIVMGLAMAIVTAQMSHKYTKMSESNLSKKKNLPTRLNAIEILAQSGHNHSAAALHKMLRRQDEPIILKQRILRTLGIRKEIKSIGIILEMLESEEEVLRLEAISSLSEFVDVKSKIRKQPFTLHRIEESLKKLLLKEKDDLVRENAVRCFHNLAPERLSTFIIQSIQDENRYSSALIRMLRVFKDPNLKFYLQPYLDGRSTQLRGASIVALWQFKDMQKELQHHIDNMLKSTKKSVLLEGIRVCGQVRYKSKQKELKRHLFSKEEDLMEAATLSLAQIGDEGIIEHLVSQMLDPKHKWFRQTEFLMKQFTKEFTEKLEARLNRHIHRSIHRILSVYKELQEIEEDTLEYLRSLYEKVHANHEAHSIKLLLDSLEK